jgi:hypothetical protein
MIDLTIFTVEEENLICAFDTSGRTTLKKSIIAAMPDFEEPEMYEIAERVIRKLIVMTDAEYSALTFNPAYHGEDDETETEG